MLADERTAAASAWARSTSGAGPARPSDLRHERRRLTASAPVFLGGGGVAVERLLDLLGVCSR